MRKEYVFADINDIAVEKENLSFQYDDKNWKITEYETGKYQGRMLTASETVFPEDVTLKLGLSGIYRIYIGLPRLRSENYLYVKTSDDLCFTGMRPTRHRPNTWGDEEFFEEVYWKTADLTDKNLIIGRPDSFFDSITAIAWIRCVPADEAELSQTVNNKCLHCHFDEDVLAEDRFNNDDDYLIKLQTLKNTNTDILSVEFAFSFDSLKNSNTAHLTRADKRYDDGICKFLPNKEKHYRDYVRFAHENGIEIYAANRMEIGNFILPYSRNAWNMNFVEQNPQFYLTNRNGVKTGICSYAFEEVGDYVINSFLLMLQYGFDGVSLILHRGMYIGFDAPVLERFNELYGDLNPCLLPLSDPRVHGVLCEFMNSFMYKLRKALDENSQKHIKINVITDYGTETAKHIGLDVEYWAKHGLVDSISQGDMEMYEDLENCMDDKNPDFIDLQKYNEELTKRAVIRRNYATNVSKVCEHIPEFLKLKELYGVEVYHVLPWVHTILPEAYEGVIKQMKKAGAEKFLCWNTNHLVWDLPEWYEVSHIGNERNRNIEQRTFHRVLSIDGCDTS